MMSSTIAKIKTAFAMPFVLLFSGMCFATDGNLGGSNCGVNGETVCDGTSAAPYQISDAADLKAFAALVNNKTQRDAWAVLTADICLNACGEGLSVLKADGTLNGDGTNFEQWTPIGDTDNRYAGTFDGDGHIIRGLYFSDASKNYVGLFGYTDKGSVIKNVGIVDSYLMGEKNVGSLVGANNANVSNCYNSGSVEGRKHYAGGLIAQNVYGIISNSYNSGNVTGLDDVGGLIGYSYSLVINSYNIGRVKGREKVGGVLGIANGELRNCYNSGIVSGSAYVGGVAGSKSKDASYCYFNTDLFFGEAIGSDNSGLTAQVYGLPAEYLGAFDPSTEFFFKDGEVNPWAKAGEDKDSYKLPYIKDLGAESQPVFEKLTVSFYDGSTSLKTMVLPKGALIPSAVLENLKKEGFKLVDLRRNLDDESSKWDFEKDVVLENVSLYAKYIGYVDGVYNIANAEDLWYFASVVNGGETNASAVLAADICLNACNEGQSVLNADGSLNGDGSSFIQWTPIGLEGKPYKGVFNGMDANGVAHTIRGLYFNDDTANYVGLFGFTDYDALIQNVGLKDSYVRGANGVGGLAGVCRSDVFNSFNAGTVIGIEKVGGLCGENYGKVKVAYNSGYVTGDDKVGGMVGYNDGSVNISYNTGVVNGKKAVGGMVGYNEQNGFISSCYNNKDFFIGNVIGEGEGAFSRIKALSTCELAIIFVSALDLDVVDFNDWEAGGEDETSYMLPYIKGFGKKTQPRFKKVIVKFYDGSTLLKSVAMPKGARISSAESMNVTKDGFKAVHFYKALDDKTSRWDFEYDVFTDDIDLYAEFMGYVNDVYQIASAEDLWIFASIVNSGSVNASAVLTADICLNACGEGESVLNADGSLNGDGKNFDQWTPIGSETNRYKGIFDGKDANGIAHTISGLYIDSDYDFGLFGSIEGATVQNVHVKDSYMIGKQDVGGVVGNAYHSNINNCSNAGTVISEYAAAGVVAYNGDGSVSNCYNTGVVVSKDFAGGVVGISSEGTVGNCRNGGSVSGSGHSVGGVIGANSGNVDICMNTGFVEGEKKVGGVVGFVGDGSVVSNVYNAGSVKGKNSVGGVVGTSDGKSVVKNGLNVGSIEGTGNYIGCMVGHKNNSTFSGSYYNSEICKYKGVGGETESADVEGLISKTSPELLAGKSLDFDFKVWVIGGVGEGAKQDTLFYPYIKDLGPAVYELGEIKKYTLSLVANGDDMGSVSGSGTFDYGTDVEIYATANEGYRFRDWQDDVKDAARSIRVVADTTFTANFEVVSSAPCAKPEFPYSSSSAKDEFGSSSTVKEKSNSSSAKAKSNSSVKSSGSSSVKEKSSSSSAKAKSGSRKGKDAAVAVAQIPQFSVTVSGNVVSIAGARPNTTLNVFDVQGNSVKFLLVASENVSFVLPDAGVYIVKNGYTAKSVNIR